MKISHLVSVLAAGIMLSGVVYAQSTIATVNGVKIPESRLKMLTKGQKLTADQQKMAKEALIQNEVITQAARKKGLASKPEVVARLDYMTQQVLLAAYLDNFMKTVTVPEAKIKEEYNYQMNMMGDKEYRIRHILVKSESDAKAVIERLNKGEKFAKLAKEKSIDKGSAANGGTLDWVSGGEFGGVLKKLPKGEYTKTPVRSMGGYHVIQVDDVRPFKKPSYEESKQQITQIVKNKMLEAHIGELMEQAKVQ